MNTYTERLNKLIEYVVKNLERKFEYEELSMVSDISKYHIDRVFRQITGEGLGDYLSKIRVEQSSVLLSKTNLPVDIVASKIGFISEKELKDCFKYFGITIKEFKNIINQEHLKKNKMKNYDKYINVMQFNGLMEKKYSFDKVFLEEKELEYEIKKIPKYKILYKDYDIPKGIDSHRGMWDEFMQSYEVARVLSYDSCGIGISKLDFNSLINSQMKYRVCVTVKDEYDLDDDSEFEYNNIDGGMYAVFSFTGKDSEVLPSYNWIYNTWMKNYKNSYKRREGYSFTMYFRRHSIKDDNDFYICIPVERA